MGASVRKSPRKKTLRSSILADRLETIQCYSRELLGVPTVGSRETRNSVLCPNPRSWSVGFDAQQWKHYHATHWVPSGTETNHSHSCKETKCTGLDLTQVWQNTDVSTYTNSCINFMHSMWPVSMILKKTGCSAHWANRFARDTCGLPFSSSTNHFIKDQIFKYKKKTDISAWTGEY
jgi:hypothetical protein